MSVAENISSIYVSMYKPIVPGLLKTNNKIFTASTRVSQRYARELMRSDFFLLYFKTPLADIYVTAREDFIFLYVVK